MTDETKDAERVEAMLHAVEQRTQDAQARLSVRVAGVEDVGSVVRLWRGQVLVGWERDEIAGGCLLRPSLLRRLVALGARVELRRRSLRLTGSPRVVAALSDEHARMAAGASQGARLKIALRFDEDGAYTQGEEVYEIGGARPTELIRMTAQLEPSAPPALERKPRGSS